MEYYNSNVIMSIGKSTDILAVDTIGLVIDFIMRMDFRSCLCSELADSTPIIFSKTDLIF
jgi:hypothetical protein